MDDLQSYGGSLMTDPGDLYAPRLSALRSSQSILPSKPYAGSRPVRSHQETMDHLNSVEALLGGYPGQPLSSTGLDGNIDNVGVGHLGQSGGKLQLTPNPLDHLNMKSRGLQLPVSHSNEVGTQEGILLPKYHVQPQSKCIMCRDCGIFFSHDSFLRHLHDNIGRRRECQSAMLELGIDNPGVQQMKTWEDFLAKLRGDHVKRSHAASYETSSVRSVSREGTQNPTSQSLGQQHRHHHVLHSPRTSMLASQRSPISMQAPHPPNSVDTNPYAPMKAEPGSISDLNRVIQNTVSESERLLRETSHYLASTDKSRHRRNRSVTMELNANAGAAPSKPHASRTLFNSGEAYANQHQKQPQDNHLAPAVHLPASRLENGAPDAPDSGDGSGTARFPQESRMFAGGDNPDNNPQQGQHNHTASSQHYREQVSVQERAEREKAPETGSRTLVNGGETGSRISFPVTNGGIMSQQDLQNYRKEDPLFILQTAQELLVLAGHRVQALKTEVAAGSDAPKSPGRDNEFLQLYHEERSKRRKFEAQIQELQDSLKEEQRQRKELEIQLRAIKLQR